MSTTAVSSRPTTNRPGGRPNRRWALAGLLPAMAFGLGACSGAPGGGPSVPVEQVPPTLSGVSVSPGSVAAGGSITISARAADASGVANVAVTAVRSADGIPASFCLGPMTRVSGSANDGEYRVTCTVDAGTSPGTYGISIQAVDVNANSALWTDTPQTSVVVTAPTGVGGAPVISAATVSPTIVDPGSPITVSARVADPDGVDFIGVNAVVRQDGGGVVWCNGPLTRTSGTSTDGVYSTTCVVPFGSLPGTYTVWLFATDTPGNSTPWPPASGPQFSVNPV